MAPNSRKILFHLLDLFFRETIARFFLNFRFKVLSSFFSFIFVCYASNVGFNNEIRIFYACLADELTKQYISVSDRSRYPERAYFVSAVTLIISSSLKYNPICLLNLSSQGNREIIFRHLATVKNFRLNLYE